MTDTAAKVELKPSDLNAKWNSVRDGKMTTCPVCKSAMQEVTPGTWLHPIERKGCFLSGHYIIDPAAWNRRAEASPEGPSNVGTPEALCDSAYIAGAKAGYNLGVDENHEGLAKLIESRAGYLSIISALEPGKAGTMDE